MNHYTISEFGSFVAEKNIRGYKPLPQKTFDALEDFLLTSRGKQTDALELMVISARKGVGKIITAKNYVGTLVMKDGTTIDILPKVFSAVSDGDPEVKAKKLLIDMLKTLRNSPYQNLQTVGVNVEKMSIFEVFIRMFVEEVFLLVKRGLKCGYETIEEDAAFFKGKPKFSQQLRRQFAHKERCFVEYDAFQVNRPENRLIKSTLQYLYPRSASAKNRTDIKTLLAAFADTEASADHQRDFERCVPDRHMKDYAQALRWCRIFLSAQSFTSFSGSQVAAALLFPMETLFESYIAALLKKQLDSGKYSVSVQDQQYHLFDTLRKFRLRPDIAVTRRSDMAVFILDTKWKILDAHHGCSQADMLQMFAYQKKYAAAHVTLIYPKTGSAVDETEYRSQDGTVVRVRFVDLFDIQNGIASLAAQLRLPEEMS